MHINQSAADRELTRLVALDRRAVQGTIDVIEQWSPTQAALPTPCTGWTVTELVAHMTVQQRGFAQAARGRRTTLADWVAVPDPDPVGAYRVACADVLDAFGDLTDPHSAVHLPELRDVPLPAAVIVGFHLVDNVVHAWDLARTIGTDVGFEGDVLTAALAVARDVPDDERRLRDGAAFAPGRPLSEGASMFEEILLRLGRDPDWRPV